MKIYFALLVVSLIVASTLADEKRRHRPHDGIAEVMKKQRLAGIRDQLSRTGMKPELAAAEEGKTGRMTLHMAEIAKRMKARASLNQEKTDTKRSIDPKNIFHSRIEHMKKLKARKLDGQ